MKCPKKKKRPNQADLEAFIVKSRNATALFDEHIQQEKKERLAGHELHYEDGSKLDEKLKMYCTQVEDGEDKLNATTLQVESMEELEERLFRNRQLTERMLNEADNESAIGDLKRGQS